VNGAKADRAAVAVHDIGLHALKDAKARWGSACWSAEAWAATPRDRVRHPRNFCPGGTSLRISKAILRVYNRYGRRDNIHKARIKILVKERGAREIRARKSMPSGRTLDKTAPRRSFPEEITRHEAGYAPDYLRLRAVPDSKPRSPRTAHSRTWHKGNVHPHKKGGLRPPSRCP